MRRIEQRGQAITVELDGDPVPAFDGEPVALSLLAAGETVFARSIKYHRPRGPYCFAAACSHCLMRVDGVPNIYTCRIPARAGMRLERQNAYPSVKVDVFQSIDWLFPRGLDHHAMFAGVPVAEQVMAKVARHLAGLGLLPDKPAPDRMPCETLRVKVAVAGGGASGSSAAARLAAQGVPFLLLERDPFLGGRRFSAPDLPRDQVRLRTPVIGLYEDDAGWYLAAVSAADASEPRLLKVYAERFLLAVGGHPPTLPFENNELPGVFSGRAATSMLRRHGLLIAEEPALVGRGPELAELQRLLESHGAKIAAVVDVDGDAKDLKAHGRNKVNGLSFARRGRRKKVDCDAILVSVPISPSFELARQGGARVSWSPPHRTFVVEAAADGRTHAAFPLYVSGELTAPHAPEESAKSGELAADAIAREARP
ncbi:MAG TPA: 2Fe-2S iron-sulfur cluster-binding protein [Myxococcaceae bacterium]|nr:2Fe-2S iron-sulfur cluster-binding protein [Myxococcaceae bacterium]